MPNQKKGLRIGRYRITPLGMGVFGGLIAVVAAIIVAIVLLTGGSPDAQSDPTLASATRSPEADVASSATASADRRANADSGTDAAQRDHSSAGRNLHGSGAFAIRGGSGDQHV